MTEQRDALTRGQCIWRHRDGDPSKGWYDGAMSAIAEETAAGDYVDDPVAAAWGRRAWWVWWSGPDNWPIRLSDVLVVWEMTAGWPCRCFYGQCIGARGVRRHAFHGFLTANSTRFPCRPIPLGLAVNAAFFATLIAVPWFTLSTTRRTFRRRRGLCVRCRYDLSGLSPNPATSMTTCPECGHASRSVRS